MTRRLFNELEKPLTFVRIISNKYFSLDYENMSINNTKSYLITVKECKA
jgi:hypothetical protein